MSTSPRRVLFVSSESRPFASTGGLADVAEALPDTLNRMGIRVDRVMPLYRTVRAGQAGGGYELKRSPYSFSIPLGSETMPVEVYTTELHGTLTYFIACDEYFDRTELYALPHREYSDNFSRFLLFQKAVVALVDALDRPYDLLHLNDWQTGLLPMLLDKGIAGTGRNRAERCLFTIHNLAYQGLFPARYLFQTNLPGNMLQHYPGLEYYGQLSFMKAGLVESDQVNTVSPSYAEEILTEPFGCGLDGVLRSLPRPVRGIVNGVDTEAWNPETDPDIKHPYSSGKLTGKTDCKKALLEDIGLSTNPELPMFVMISRLVDQKGVPLLEEAMEKIMSLPLQLVILGSGQEKYHELIESWNQRWADKFKGIIGYHSSLSHQMEAGGDFFLMPSQFEPCGLNQLYSLRYGTVPIVNRTGGLQDTVTDCREDSENGTGFVMLQYSAESLLNCMRDAVSLFHDRKTLRRIRQRGMRQDVSWTRTAESYVSLYRELCE